MFRFVWKATLGCPVHRRYLLKVELIDCVCNSQTKMRVENDYICVVMSESVEAEPRGCKEDTCFVVVGDVEFEYFKGN